MSGGWEDWRATTQSRRPPPIQSSAPGPCLKTQILDPPRRSEGWKVIASRIVSPNPPTRRPQISNPRAQLGGEDIVEGICGRGGWARSVTVIESEAACAPLSIFVTAAAPLPASPLFSNDVRHPHSSRQNNLQGISFYLPHRALSVITGLRARQEHTGVRPLRRGQRSYIDLYYLPSISSIACKSLGRPVEGVARRANDSGIQ